MTAMQFLPSVPEEAQQRIRNFFAELDARKTTELSSSAELKPESSYEKYLRSQKWKTIRRRVLKRDDGKCTRCDGKATHVHHRSYADDVLLGENDGQLASICEGCHTTIHFNEVGAKRSHEDTDRLLYEGCCDVNIPAPKVDMRRRSPQYPPEWLRMTAVQRDAWTAEYSRLRLIRMRERASKQTWRN